MEKEMEMEFTQDLITINMMVNGEMTRKVVKVMNFCQEEKNVLLHGNKIENTELVPILTQKGKLYTLIGIGIY
jgi:hypothetical protein